MKQYFFFNVFRKTLVMFLDIFNDIKIARYASNGKTIDRYITVPIKHSVKEKVYYWLNERKDDEILPMITAYISSIDPAIDRKVNSFQTLTSSCDLANNTAETFLHPIPYNLTFTMNLWALHMTDIDQILEQILPFFSPHIFARMRISELNTSFDVKIIFRGATPEISHEMADMEYRVLNYTLDFELQAWFFKPTSNTDLIHKIYTNYLDPGASLNTTSTFSSGASGGVLSSSEIKGVVEDGETLIQYTLFDPH